MIVICDKCNTKYKLDDATITEEGVKVRCSKCGNTFIVKKPKAEDIQKMGQFPDESQDAGSRMDIHSDLDRAINETINTIASDQPGSPEAGTEFDWSGLSAEEKQENPKVQEAEEPAALEWTPESQPGQDTDLIQAAESVIKDIATDSPATQPEPVHEEPKPLPPTVEHVVRESIKQGRSEYIPRALLSVVKKIGLSLVVLAAVAVSGYFAYVYRQQLSRLGSEMTEIVSSYMTSHKPVSIGVSVSDSRGYFLKNIRGQQLFVISGTVTNVTKHSVSFIKLTATILDNNNTIISTKDFYAGNVLSDDDLRTLTSDQINSNLNNEMGQSLKNFNIPSDTGIPFMVVFFDVPDNLTSFTVVPKSVHQTEQ